MTVIVQRAIEINLILGEGAPDCCCGDGDPSGCCCDDLPDTLYVRVIQDEFIAGDPYTWLHDQEIFFEVHKAADDHYCNSCGPAEPASSCDGQFWVGQYVWRWMTSPGVFEELDCDFGMCCGRQSESALNFEFVWATVGTGYCLYCASSDDHACPVTEIAELLDCGGSGAPKSVTVQTTPFV